MWPGGESLGRGSQRPKHAANGMSGGVGKKKPMTNSGTSNCMSTSVRGAVIGTDGQPTSDDERGRSTAKEDHSRKRRVLDNGTALGDKVRRCIEACRDQNAATNRARKRAHQGKWNQYHSQPLHFDDASGTDIDDVGNHMTRNEWECMHWGHACMVQSDGVRYVPPERVLSYTDKTCAMRTAPEYVPSHASLYVDRAETQLIQVQCC